MQSEPQLNLFETEEDSLDYVRLPKGIFLEESFETLSKSAQSLYLYLYSHPDMTGLGLLFKTVGGIASERAGRASESSTRNGFESLESAGWVWTPRDETQPSLYLPCYLSLNPPQTRSAFKDWPKQLKRVRCDVLQKFILARLFVLRSTWPDFLLEALDKRMGVQVEGGYKAIQNGEYNKRTTPSSMLESYNHTGDFPPVNHKDKESAPVVSRAPVEPKIQWTPEEGFTNITEARLRRWKEAYPGVNVELKIKQLNEWLLAKGKRYKNYQMFLTRCFARDQDRKGWTVDRQGHTPQPKQVRRGEMPF